eukprot:Clim_evm79s25 gene=Clim_evmTU79s25
MATAHSRLCQYYGDLRGPFVIESHDAHEYFYNDLGFIIIVNDQGTSCYKLCGVPLDFVSSLQVFALVADPEPGKYGVLAQTSCHEVRKLHCHFFAFKQSAIRDVNYLNLVYPKTLKLCNSPGEITTTCAATQLPFWIAGNFLYRTGIADADTEGRVSHTSAHTRLVWKESIELFLESEGIYKIVATERVPAMTTSVRGDDLPMLQEWDVLSWDTDNPPSCVNSHGVTWQTDGFRCHWTNDGSIFCRSGHMQPDVMGRVEEAPELRWVWNLSWESSGHSTRRVLVLAENGMLYAYTFQYTSPPRVLLLHDGQCIKQRLSCGSIRKVIATKHSVLLMDAASTMWRAGIPIDYTFDMLELLEPVNFSQSAKSWFDRCQVAGSHLQSKIYIMDTGRGELHLVDVEELRSSTCRGSGDSTEALLTELKSLHKESSRHGLVVKIRTVDKYLRLVSDLQQLKEPLAHVLRVVGSTFCLNKRHTILSSATKGLHMWCELQALEKWKVCPNGRALEVHQRLTSAPGVQVCTIGLPASDTGLSESEAVKEAVSFTLNRNILPTDVLSVFAYLEPLDLLLNVLEPTIVAGIPMALPNALPADVSNVWDGDHKFAANVLKDWDEREEGTHQMAEWLEVESNRPEFHEDCTFTEDLLRPSRMFLKVPVDIVKEPEPHVQLIPTYAFMRTSPMSSGRKRMLYLKHIRRDRLEVHADIDSILELFAADLIRPVGGPISQPIVAGLDNNANFQRLCKRYRAAKNKMAMMIRLWSRTMEPVGHTGCDDKENAEPNHGVSVTTNSNCPVKSLTNALEEGLDTRLHSAHGGLLRAEEELMVYMIGAIVKK